MIITCSFLSVLIWNFFSAVRVLFLFIRQERHRVSLPNGRNAECTDHSAQSCFDRLPQRSCMHDTFLTIRLYDECCDSGQHVLTLSHSRCFWFDMFDERRVHIWSSETRLPPHNEQLMQSDRKLERILRNAITTRYIIMCC